MASTSYLVLIFVRLTDFQKNIILSLLDSADCIIQQVIKTAKTDCKIRPIILSLLASLR